MSVIEFVHLLRQRWWYIVLPAFLGLGAGFAVNHTTVPTFQSTSTVYFSLQIGGGGTAGELYLGSNYTQQQLASYAALTKTPMVLAPVIAELDLPQTPASLARSVAAVTSSDTVLIDIQVTQTDPTRAAAIANAVAAQLGRVVHDLTPRASDDTSPQVEVVTVGEATPAGSPSSPKRTQNLVIGLLGGLLLGLAAAIARDRLDTRVRRPVDFEPVALLGETEHRRASAKQVLAEAAGDLQAENYRRIRTNLQFLDISSPTKVFGITSSVLAEGKSTMAVNLASVFAHSGLEVVLVDADLRRPRLAEYLDIDGSVGLSNVLAEQVDLSLAVQKWGPNPFTVLPCGTIPPNPSELLGSSAMAGLVADLRSRFDVVIFDTPPLLPVPDAVVVSAHCDGMIVAARANKVRRAQLATALTSLENVDARVLGVVLTMVRRTKSAGYGPYTKD